MLEALAPQKAGPACLMLHCRVPHCCSWSHCPPLLVCLRGLGSGTESGQIIVFREETLCSVSCFFMPSFVWLEACLNSRPSFFRNPVSR